MEDDDSKITLGEVYRNLQAFNAQTTSTLSDLKSELKTKASSTDIADFRGELRAHDRRILGLEAFERDTKLKESGAAENRQKGQRKLSILYGLGLILVTVMDILLHTFVK